MFGNNNKNKEAGKTKSGAIMPSSTSHSLNSLVQGTSVEGTVQSKSDIRVDGKIKGILNCEAKVIIGPTGFIDGEVQCKNAVVEGHFEGVLSVGELLNIRESAKVSGEVTYGKLIVQSGAVINGTYKVIGQETNGTIKPAKDVHKVVNSAKSTDSKNIAGKAQFKKETAN